MTEYPLRDPDEMALEMELKQRREEARDTGTTRKEIVTVVRLDDDFTQ